MFDRFCATQNTSLLIVWPEYWIYYTRIAPSALQWRAVGRIFGEGMIFRGVLEGGQGDHYRNNFETFALKQKCSAIQGLFLKTISPIFHNFMLLLKLRLEKWDSDKLPIMQDIATQYQDGKHLKLTKINFYAGNWQYVNVKRQITRTETEQLANVQYAQKKQYQIFKILFT